MSDIGHVVGVRWWSRQDSLPTYPDLRRCRDLHSYAIACGSVIVVFVGGVDRVRDEALGQVLDAKPRIPGLLWGGLLFGGVLLIGLIGFTRLDNRRNHMILSSAIAVLLGLLLFLIFWLDHPFGRQLGVTPTSFDYTIQVFDGVDQGT